MLLIIDSRDERVALAPGEIRLFSKVNKNKNSFQPPKGNTYTLNASPGEDMIGISRALEEDVEKGEATLSPDTN